MAFLKKKQIPTSEEIIETEDLEISEPEFYRGSEISFSHERDVARVIKKVSDAGCKEMTAGFFDFKKDKNSGQLLESKYHNDSRQEYIESVNSFIDILISEIDSKPEFKKKIEELENQKLKMHKNWAGLEHSWWLKQPPTIRAKIDHMQGSISKTNKYHDFYMNDLVLISRQIVRTLHRLLAELKYFKGTEAEN
jgi:hypothetical protein